MPNLNKTVDPRRVLVWKGKSLATCSRDELIECIIYITRRLAAYEFKNTPQAVQKAGEIPPEAIPSEAIEKYNGSVMPNPNDVEKENEMK